MGRTAPLGPGLAAVERLIGALCDLGELAADVCGDSRLRLVLRPVVARLAREFDATNAVVYEAKGGARRLELVIAEGAPGAPAALVLPEATERTWSRGGAFPFAVDDPSIHPAERQVLVENQGTATALGTEVILPLAIRGRVHAAMLLGRKTSGFPYSPLELNVLAVMGRQIALGFHSRSQRTEQQRTQTDLAKLQQVNQRLHATLKPSLIKWFLVSEAAGLVNGRRSLLFTYDETQGLLHLDEAFNFTFRDWHPGQAFKVAGNWLEPIIDLKEGLVLDALADIPREAECYSCLAVPLLVKRNQARGTTAAPDEFEPATMKVTGVLCVFDKEERFGIGEFTPEDNEILGSMALAAGAALENARLYEQATVDGLTRLYIRRHFEQKLGEELRKAAAQATPVSLILVDIDHFKRFNDTHGHQVGDLVLAQVAQQLARNVRDDIDVPARYGGEELLALLPDTDSQGALAVAERIRLAVEGMALKGPAGETLQVTISLGIATVPEHAATGEELIACADLALYASKRGGRNRATLYSSTLQPTT